MHRFRATVAANVLGAAASFAAAVILARGLGAAGYGRYSFLLASFAALSSAIDLGTSSAFYTFMSQGRGQAEHLRVFSLWTILRVAAIVLALLLLPSALLDKAWLGERRLVVVVAFLAFFLSQPFAAFLIQVAESARRTVFVQSASAGLAWLHVALLLVLWRLGALSAARVLALVAAEYAAFLLFFVWRFDWSVLSRGEKRSWREVTGQYAAYCAPLVLMCAVDFPCQFADRWLLQYFGGSAQQGYFSFGQQFAAIALLATVSLLNIFWKEVAEAQRLGDVERVRRLYRRSSRSLFFAASCGAGFLVWHSAWLLSVFAGRQFAGGAAALSLMLLYPSFQSLGQINGAFFYATEDTRTHVRINVAALLAGLPLTYFVLASPSAAVPGLGLGAAGLAGRMAFLQIAAVSAQCLVVARRQNSPSDLANPFLVLGALLSVGFLAKTVAGAWPGIGGWGIFLLSGAVYAGAVALLARAFPERAGVTREQLGRLAFLVE